ncbi:MAG: FAD-dependent monooxygenase [Actinoallomurus sp.]
MSNAPGGNSLDVVVVGAGIGGLAAAVCLRTIGARVTLLEQASAIGEVGAGIQLAPNATRALAAIGVADRLRPDAVAATRSLRRRWQNGALLGSYLLGAEIERRFGAPYWHAHRVDLHAALLRAATDPDGAGAPVTLQLGAAVWKVEQDRLRVSAITTEGARYPADVLIGADGIHSRVREMMVGADKPQFSGDVAYRALIPTDALTADPTMGELTRERALTIWLGPHCHLVHYYVRAGSLLNVVAMVPGEQDAPESWSARGDKSELLDALAGWHPTIHKLISAAPVVNRWALYDREPLDSWILGRIALLGDSCHSMLPYQAQGAAQALEDALALGKTLQSATPETVAEALGVYEAERSVRASRVQRASRKNREIFHLPDGPQQHQRDAELRHGGADYESYAWLWSGDHLTETV